MVLSSKLRAIKEDLRYIRKAKASINAKVASDQETEHSKAIAEILDRLPTNDLCLLGRIARRQKKRLQAARAAGDNADLELLPEDKVTIEEISQRAAERWDLED